MITQIQLQLVKETLQVRPRPADEAVLHAVQCVGNFYCRTNDRMAAYLLSEVIRDSLIPEHIRSTAYILLLEVVSCPLELFPKDFSIFDFHRDVRWDIIDQYRADEAEQRLELT